MNRILTIVAALAFCVVAAPASAQQQPPTTQTLASAIVATANQAFTSANIGNPSAVTVCMSASAATTFTVTESIDGATFYQASLPASATSANYAPSAAGTLCEAVAPASYVKIATSAAVTVTIQLQAVH